MSRPGLRLLLAAALVLAPACGDRGITTPAATPKPQKPTSGLRAATQAPTVQAVRVLERTTPLPHRLSASAVIGPRGGVIALPGSGLRVEFSTGAVSKPTRITLTAIEGQDVAYEFQPHGLRFGAPVTVHQDLEHTVAEHDEPLAQSLQGSYFAGDLAADFVDAQHHFARINESRHGKLKKNIKFLEFTVEHFSGYMVSTGLVSIDIEIGSR
jgi:hypothetical protein